MCEICAHMPYMCRHVRTVRTYEQDLLRICSGSAQDLSGSEQDLLRICQDLSRICPGSVQDLVWLRICPGSEQDLPGSVQDLSRIWQDLAGDLPRIWSGPGSGRSCQNLAGEPDLPVRSDFKEKTCLEHFFVFSCDLGVPERFACPRPDPRTVLYRPLYTAKHFANDRPRRGPKTPSPCTSPHETVFVVPGFAHYPKNSIS